MTTSSPVANEYLLKEELQSVTGWSQVDKQVTWLREKGIPYRIDGKRVIVSRVHVRAWLEGRTPVPSRGPNWKVLERA